MMRRMPLDDARRDDRRPASIALETERVRLRALRPDDLNALHAAVLSDPVVTCDGRARTLAEGREALGAKLRHAEERGFGMMAVVDRQRAGSCSATRASSTSRMAPTSRSATT